MARRRRSPEAFGLTQPPLSLVIVKRTSGEEIRPEDREKEVVVANEETRRLTRSDQRPLPEYDRRDRKGRLVQRIWHPQGRTSGNASRRRRSTG